jgi:hypothetical protein
MVSFSKTNARQVNSLKDKLKILPWNGTVASPVSRGRNLEGSPFQPFQVEAEAVILPKYQLHLGSLPIEENENIA